MKFSCGRAKWTKIFLVQNLYPYPDTDEAIGTLVNA